MLSNATRKNFAVRPAMTDATAKKITDARKTFVHVKSSESY